MCDQQRFGVTAKKEEDFSSWYIQTLLRGNMFDYYEISGLYIMKPQSMFIWNKIKDFFTAEISKLGVKEVYFPMLLTKESIEREKGHVENFAPELAWITRCGDNDIEPIAVRPTSESIMYPVFSKWVKTHRDLPLQVNQWCSVLRWEVKSTLPFIRGREFLWQEGHSVFENAKQCEDEVSRILKLYEKIYSELLAVPTILGIKSENEKFGGAEYTRSVECFIPETGRGVQAATSHFLGTNFSKIFDVKLEGFLYQNSWGITTRSIGIATMLHSDNRGLVLPPRVAMVQIAVVPCGITKTLQDSDRELLMNYIREVVGTLGGFRVELDDRENVTPGYKFNHWELQGVPIRVEIGPRNMKGSSVTIVRRCDGGKKDLPFGINFADLVAKEIEDIHNFMFKKQSSILGDLTVEISDFKTMLAHINGKKIAKGRWCGRKECEENIKKNTIVYSGDTVVTTGAKSICIVGKEEGFCFNCREKSEFLAIFGRTY